VEKAEAMTPDLDALNTALRLGAELQDVPVGSVVKLHWMSTRYMLTTAKVLPPISHGSILVECIVPGEFVFVVGARRGTLPKDILELVSLPDDWTGNPMGLLAPVAAREERSGAV
jgi:hypothetical protein